MIKYVLIGAGRIAKNHVLSVKENEYDLIFSGICDVELSNIERCLESADYKKMLINIQIINK